MTYKVDNAIIMAAGVSSRFAPLSYEKPKALLKVKGEVLLERQIKQLQLAGIRQIIIVVGYKKELFSYLVPKYGVQLIENKVYASHNNSSSIYAARNFLQNTYICSADNYFTNSPFNTREPNSYYAALQAFGPTGEWCMEIDQADWIKAVSIGGTDCWYMLGHSFWDEKFSQVFNSILMAEYGKPATRDMYWEDLFVQHLDRLPMQIRRYEPDDIFEFDSLDELRGFDPAYQTDSGSAILAEVSRQLSCPEKDLHSFLPEKGPSGQVTGFSFSAPGGRYIYTYADAELIKQDTKA